MTVTDDGEVVATEGRKVGEKVGMSEGELVGELRGEEVGNLVGATRVASPAYIEDGEGPFIEVRESGLTAFFVSQTSPTN